MEVNFKLYPYQRKAVDALDAVTDLNGSRVLEIGSGASLDTAMYLLHKGADAVICIDNRKQGIPEVSTRRIQYVSGDAGYMPFADESVDALLGVAVLEHLPEIDNVASEIYRVLKPGGMAYLTGGPFWASHCGHHVYVVKKDVRYCFNEGNNPVPDWGHLLYGGSELKRILRDRGVLRNHVEEIIHMIYESNGINRLSPVHIENVFSALPFDVKARYFCWKAPSEEVRRKLLSKGTPFQKDLEISEMYLTLCK